MPKVKKSWLGNLWKKIKIARTMIAAVLAVAPFLRKLVALIGDAEMKKNGADKKKKVLEAFSTALRRSPWKTGSTTQNMAIRVAGVLIEVIVWLKNRRGHDWRT